jgi:hypothetical protein
VLPLYFSISGIALLVLPGIGWSADFVLRFDIVAENLMPEVDRLGVVCSLCHVGSGVASGQCAGAAVKASGEGIAHKFTAKETRKYQGPVEVEVTLPPTVARDEINSYRCELVVGRASGPWTKVTLNPNTPVWTRADANKPHRMLIQDGIEPGTGASP